MSITEATNDLRKENPSNKRDMETEEIQKLNRGLENLPQKELYVVAKIIKKRGVPQKQNNEKLQLDINNIEVIKTGNPEQKLIFSSSNGLFMQYPKN